MGKRQDEPFQLSLNASLEVDFQGSGVTLDGGLMLARELDERLGLGDLIAEHLSDAHRGKNIQLPLADPFRQSVYSRMAGYEDANDAERLSQDPTFRLEPPTVDRPTNGRQTLRSTSRTGRCVIVSPAEED